MDILLATIVGFTAGENNLKAQTSIGHCCNGNG
jgi:hypothetical protein